MVQNTHYHGKVSSFTEITPIYYPASLPSYSLPLFRIMCQITLSHRELASNTLHEIFPSPDDSVQTYLDYCLASFFPAYKPKTPLEMLTCSTHTSSMPLILPSCHLLTGTFAFHASTLHYSAGLLSP